MIIFYKKNSISPAYTPVVLLDFTRSDDQFTPAQILRWVVQAAPLGAVISPEPASIFSLNYSVVYRHSAINPADALKTSVEINVSNAPPELISLVQVRQIVGQETVMSLENALSKVVDAKNQFSRASLVFNVPGPLGIPQTIVRQFMVYATTYNFDTKRVNSTLTARGAAYDSKVMRLGFNFNIDKSLPIPLVNQLRKYLLTIGFDCAVGPEDAALALLLPVVSRYYPPAPLDVMLTRVCNDNSIWFDLDPAHRTVTLKSLNELSPPLDPFPATASFRGAVPGSYVISSFSVRDYATAVFKTEAFDAALFGNVNIFNDSGAPDLFDNFRPALVPPPRPYQGRPAFFYGFYVLEYALIFNAVESSVEIVGSNNWLVSNFRLDTFFENAVYADVSE